MILTNFPFKNKFKNYLLGASLLGLGIIATDFTENKPNNSDCVPCAENNVNKSCVDLLIWSSCKKKGCRWIWKVCDVTPPVLEIPPKE